jgi:hypothetical protein
MSERKRFSKRPPDGPFGANASWIHGGCGTPEYRAYTTAKTLCANHKNPRWLRYGGRGTEFRFSSFASFLEHLGRRPAGKVLDRLNREGHFETGNIYWRRKRRKKLRTLPVNIFAETPTIKEGGSMVNGASPRRRPVNSMRMCALPAKRAGVHVDY